MDEAAPAPPLVFYASQSGKPTLDQCEGGGNPFASALIELLERPSLTNIEFHSGLIALTIEKSNGYQVPDVPAASNTFKWVLKPVPVSAKRVALIFVFSDYHNAGVRSLPGAVFDLERIDAALRNAGFDVQTETNPSMRNLLLTVSELSRKSEEAEVSIIYMTGHDIEYDDEVYLLRNDYPFDKGPDGLIEYAVNIPILLGSLKAKCANLLFFGGCRTCIWKTRPAG